MFRISAGTSTLIQMDEQRSSASTSQRTDSTLLVAGEETTVETTRQERTPEEDIIGILANMTERNRTHEFFFYLFFFFRQLFYTCVFLCVFYIPDVTGEMEVTVQEDEERPPPPPPEEQTSSSESRDPRTANRNPTLELAESIVDSVLGPCTSEATIRLSNYTYVITKEESRLRIL